MGTHDRHHAPAAERDLIRGGYMARLREWLTRAMTPFRRRKDEQRTEAEMRFHMDMEIQAGLKRGLSREEAERQARLRAGFVDAALDEVRDQRGLGWLDGTVMDLAARVVGTPPPARLSGCGGRCARRRGCDEHPDLHHRGRGHPAPTAIPRTGAVGAGLSIHAAQSEVPGFDLQLPGGQAREPHARWHCSVYPRRPPPDARGACRATYLGCHHRRFPSDARGFAGIGPQFRTRRPASEESGWSC